MHAGGFLWGVLLLLVTVHGGCGGRSIGHLDGSTVPQADGSCRASPLELARATEAAQAFLAEYGTCEGCNPDYAKGVENLIGCVLYEVQDGCAGPPACKDATWMVSFWLGEVCSFRYGRSKEKLVVEIGKRSCQPMSISPAIEVIKDPRFCRSDADCVCLSGSGMPLVGCANAFHGPLCLTGSYTCSACRCTGNRCAEQ